MLSSRVVFALRAASPSSSSLLAAAARAGGRRASAVRFAQVPIHAAFSTKKNDEEYETQSHSLPPLQTVEELIAENSALKKEVAELKEKIATAKPGLLGTIKQYGLPFFIWWTGLYFGTGVALYAAFDTGVLDGAQVIDTVMSLGLDRLIDPERLDPKHGNLALAIIVNEAIEPLRFPLAIATIPMVKRVFSREKKTN
jgi:hypothetical protein